MFFFTGTKQKGVRGSDVSAGQRNIKVRRLSLLATVAVALVMGLLMHSAIPVVSADPPAVPPPSVNPQAVPPASANPQAPPAQANPLDEPLRLLLEAHKVYQQVQDYTCTMVKQERVGGQLQPENVITMKFRQQPFSVCMHWHSPRQFNGQIVCYVHGKNDNKMRVRSSGVLGVVGFVNIAPDDKRAMEHSRHKITEAGLGNLISRLYHDWAKERQRNRTRIQVAEYQFNQRPCVRVEMTNLQRREDDQCWRSVVYFDKETRLPVRVECYDYPRQDGPPEGELLEVYSYINMRFNTGLTDKDFSY